MTLIKSIKHKFQTSLDPFFSINDIQFIWNQWVVKEILKMSLVDYFSNNNVKISELEHEAITLLTLHLLKNKPIQYFFGYMYFQNIKISVDPNVLIPRPETDQLVDIVTDDLDNKKLYNIIDIGTGSGCIAISLKKNMPCDVVGVDICDKALTTAISNAKSNNVDVNFQLLDILNPENYRSLPKFDVIVSNPPYVLKSEVSSDSNIHFEPSSAIFVPDKNPLVFYEAICVFSQTKLNKNGKIFLEINPNLVSELHEMLSNYFVNDIKVCEDFYGKKRFIVVSF